jgi:hypothetical protein
VVRVDDHAPGSAAAPRDQDDEPEPVHAASDAREADPFTPPSARAAHEVDQPARADGAARDVDEVADGYTRPEVPTALPDRGRVYVI